MRSVYVEGPRLSTDSEIGLGTDFGRNCSGQQVVVLSSQFLVFGELLWAFGYDGGRRSGIRCGVGAELQWLGVGGQGLETVRGGVDSVG